MPRRKKEFVVVSIKTFVGCIILFGNGILLSHMILVEYRKHLSCRQMPMLIVVRSSLGTWRQRLPKIAATWGSNESLKDYPSVKVVAMLDSSIVSAKKHMTPFDKVFIDDCLEYDASSTDSLHSCCGIAMSIWHARNTLVLDRWEWLFVVDDDAYVSPSNLQLSLCQQYDSKDALAVGVTGCSHEDKVGFCGGGGIGFSRMSILRLVGSKSRKDFLDEWLNVCSECAYWGDVAAGVIAQNHDLRVQYLYGLEPWPITEKEQQQRLEGSEFLPLVWHYSVDRMQHIHDAHQKSREWERPVVEFYKRRIASQLQQLVGFAVRPVAPKQLCVHGSVAANSLEHSCAPYRMLEHVTFGTHSPGHVAIKCTTDKPLTHQNVYVYARSFYDDHLRNSFNKYPKALASYVNNADFDSMGIPVVDWCDHIAPFSRFSVKMNFSDGEAGVYIVYEQQLRPRTWYVFLDLCNSSLLPLDLSCTFDHWQPRNGAMSWEHGLDTYACRILFAFFVACRYKMKGLGMQATTSLRAKPISRVTVLDVLFLSFLFGAISLEFAQYGLHIESCNVLANALVVVAHVLVTQEIPVFVAVSMHGSVFISYIARRWSLATPAPHELALLLCGGGSVRDTEPEKLFLFEWLNVIVAIALLAFQAWRKKYRQSQKVVYSVSFAMCLGLLPPLTKIFDPRWRQRVRLLIAVVRLLSAAAIGRDQMRLASPEVSKSDV